MEGALLKASKERADAVQKLDAHRRESGGNQKGALGDFASMFGGKDTKGIQELKSRLREVTDQLEEQKVYTDHEPNPIIAYTLHTLQSSLPSEFSYVDYHHKPHETCIPQKVQTDALKTNTKHLFGENQQLKEQCTAYR
jgi:hypothetical protein